MPFSTCVPLILLSSVYETVARPVLEYASTVWSPCLKKDIELMESAQDRALNLASTPHGCDTLDERRNVRSSQKHTSI